jgi:hypothetical protein
MCDSCGKVFDHAVVAQRNPHVQDQMTLKTG